MQTKEPDELARGGDEHDPDEVVRGLQEHDPDKLADIGNEILSDELATTFAAIDDAAKSDELAAVLAALGVKQDLNQ